jgi:hypothetical protein
LRRAIVRAQLGEPRLNQRFEPPELRLLQRITESELLDPADAASNGGRACNKRLQVLFLPREQIALLPDFCVSEIPEQVRKLNSQVVVMLALPGSSREVLGAPEGYAPYDAQDHQSEREAQIDLEPQAGAQSTRGTGGDGTGRIESWEIRHAASM